MSSAEDRDALFHAIRSRSCVAFVGSGPSRPHYPGWPELVHKLCEACGVEPPSAEGQESAETLLEKAAECRRADEDRYRDALTSVFGGEVYDVPRIYSHIATLPFLSYVTTNFDPTLRTALESIPHKCDGVHVFPSLPVHAIARHRLFHIHGLVVTGAALDPDRIILGKSDFDRAYSDEASPLRSFLVQLFIYNACCFIGIGLREPELRQLFLACAAFRRTQQRDHPHVEPPRHYAVMPMLYRKTADAGVNERDLEAEGVEARTFADLGITVVRYEPVDERHLGLIQLFGECLQLPTVPIRSGFEPETIE